jgi:hypothetical protein
LSTNAYAAKRAIFDRLRERSHQPSNRLSDALVSYADPGKFAEGHMVYGGGIVFDQPKEDELADGDDILTHELATIGVHVRVEIPTPEDGRGCEVSDEICEGIGEEIGEMFRADRHLAGGTSITRIAGGQCDQGSTDTTVTSTLTYYVDVESDFKQ